MTMNALKREYVCKVARAEVIFTVCTMEDLTIALTLGLAAETVRLAPLVLVIGFACFKVRMAAAKEAALSEELHKKSSHQQLFKSLKRQEKISFIGWLWYAESTYALGPSRKSRQVEADKWQSCFCFVREIKISDMNAGDF